MPLALLPLVAALLHAGRAPSPVFSSLHASSCVRSLRMVALPSISVNPKKSDLAPVTLLYDGNCMVCLKNRDLLRWFDKSNSKLKFVDVRSSKYNPADNGGILYSDAMRSIHCGAFDLPNCPLHEGTVTSVHGLLNLLELLLSRHRHTISRWLPGGDRLANAVDSLNDIETAAHGGGCEEEEECMLPDFDDE
ncbi:MAG: hypothetical protein SGPRY_010969 [Prymnesium sp.]